MKVFWRRDQHFQSGDVEESRPRATVWAGLVSPAEGRKRKKDQPPWNESVSHQPSLQTQRQYQLFPGPPASHLPGTWTCQDHSHKHTHTLHNIYIHKIYRYYFARLENGVHRIREPVSLQPARWRDGGTGHPRRIQHKHGSPERRGSTMLPLLCCDPGFGKPHGDQAANLSLHHHHL